MDDAGLERLRLCRFNVSVLVLHLSRGLMLTVCESEAKKKQYQEWQNLKTTHPLFTLSSIIALHDLRNLPCDLQNLDGANHLDSSSTPLKLLGK
jgi:hypothetical protein